MSQHDLKNALLFLDTFPLLLKQFFDDKEKDESELEELFNIYREKLSILKEKINDK